MGVDLGDILPAKETELEALNGRIIAIDAYNTLYQFLAIIRQRDGSPLTNSEGEITSHLSGLLYRTSRLTENGIKPVFVFDGEPPEKKSEELKKRVKIRKKAREKWEEALEKGKEKEARKHAQQATSLSKKMVAQSKELLDHLGIPSVQAPSEGEAQASEIAEAGDAWAVGSQDFDVMLFGAPALVRNMTVTGRRKIPGKNAYKTIKPELLKLKEVEEELGIRKEELIEIALMIGTDYHEGIKGVGPKTALKKVREGKKAEEVFEENDLEAEGLEHIRELFKNPDVTEDYDISWEEADEENTVEFLSGEHDFSEGRVRKAVERIKRNVDLTGKQSRLNKWS